MESYDVAIVGLGATLPGALDPESFWADQLAGRHRIARLPQEIWDVDRLVDPTRKRPDRPYSGIGAVVRGMRFDPREFAMPPRTFREMDPCQQAALVTARQALADAGIEGPTGGLRAAVFLGNVQGGSQARGEGWFRVTQPLLEDTLADLPSFKSLSAVQRERLVDELRERWRDQYPPVTGDSLPGLLGNLIAARIAHYYDLRGPALAIDAACASSLVAIEQAVRGLRDRRFDLAVAGGVDFQMDAPTYAGFCAMGALSPDGSYPFDRRANGFVMGEGAVTFVLKRLEDAERADDRVYAVIHGVGLSSDGRGRALVAPSVDGQVRAIREAWQDARRSPESLGYVEAHGTATMIGDPVEIAAMREAFGALAPGSVPMGSVKANLGHLKAAAGAVGMLRAVLALHEGVVPPQAGFQTPNPRCKLDASPVRLPREPETFARERATAAVSAFGFGGINAHVVLGRAPGRAASGGRPRAPLRPPLELPIVAFGAPTRDTLAEAARRLRARNADPFVLARELAAGPAVRHERHRVAIHAMDAPALTRALDALVEVLEGRASEKRLEALGVALSEEAARAPSAVAFMFPGQGSQYVGMLDALRARFPIVQATFDEADALVEGLLPEALSRYVFPGAGSDAGEAFRALCRTEVLQPAMLTCDEALRRLLVEIVTPGFVLGHSLGEYGACVAASVLDFADALRIVAVRGSATARVSLHDDGLMLGVSADEATVRAHLEGVDGYVDAVNKNCPTQTIVGGASHAVRAADERLRAAGLETLFLPVSHAFHSRIVAPVSPLLAEALASIDVRAPRIPVLSNVTADYYPSGEDASDRIRALLAEQVARPVEFIRMIERAYADGARVFVEVGPKRAQVGFVGDILRGKPHRAVPLCHPKVGELEAFGRAIAALVVEGVVAYGDVRRRAVVDPDALAWRPPYVPRREGTPVCASESPEREAEAASVSPMPVAAFAPVALASNGSFAALDDVAGDPRFWQFVASQAPALAGFVKASFQAATRLDAHVAAEAPVLSVVAGGVPRTPSAPPPSAVKPTRPHVVKSEATKPLALDVASKLETARDASAPKTLAELTGWVLARVAAVTGYAVAELGLDADFEAELGIDSIRQIEVVVEIRDALGLPADEGFKIGDHPNLRSLIGYLARRIGIDARTGASTPVDRVGEPVPRGPVPAATPDGDLTEWLLARVAAKTGYTRTELSLDADLESELGIDSILQIEIVVDVRDALGLPVDDAFKMSDYPTLRALIRYLEAKRGARAEDARPFDGARPTTDVEPGADDAFILPYFVRHVTLEPAPPHGVDAAPAPLLVLHAGAPQAAIDAFGGDAAQVDDDADEAALTARVRAHAPRTLVDLRALARTPGDAGGASRAALVRVFRTARALLASDAPLERVLVVTRIDGALGFDRVGEVASHRAASGAAIGAWKAFAREWTEHGRAPFALTVVDVDAQTPWTTIAAEGASAAPLEVALGGGHRRVPVLRSLAIAGDPLPTGAVVVALGGGRGITALIAARLAKMIRARLVVVGRTRLVPGAHQGDARARARATLGPDAKAPDVTSLARRIEREAELARTLEAMRAEGIDIAYEEADVADGARVAEVLAAVRARHGRIDVVLHGAGVDRSRTIDAKDEGELASIIAPKLGPVDAMISGAGDARWVVLSSVAARFGNAGQIDYAAANEALAKVCLARGGLVLGFSAWADVGMAAPLGRALASRGVDLLAAEATARWAADAIAGGRAGEWVVAGRMGTPRAPVLGATVASLVPGASVEHAADLALGACAFLRDHRVRTAGVLPGVVALAALEQAALALEPTLGVVGLREVRFDAPLKVFPTHATEVRVRAERLRAVHDALLISASTWTSVLHHHGVVRLAPTRSPAPSASRASDAGSMREGPDREVLYRAFFHGPSFQVIASSRVGEDVAWTRAVPLALPLGEDVPAPARVRALAREVALQACGICLQYGRGELALPVGVDELDVHDDAHEGEVVEALARLRHADATARVLDVTLSGADGRVIESLRGVRFRLLGKLGG